MTSDFNAILIPGIPIAYKRVRIYRRHGQVIAINPNSKEKIFTQIYLKSKKIYMLGNISLKCKFYMPIPKCLQKKILENQPHTNKPDVDNLLKFLLDCLSGVCIEDDRKVSKIESQKLYSSSPRTEIILQNL